MCDDTYAVSAEFMQPFGAIVQWYARHEVLMQFVMAKISGSDPHAAIIMTMGLGAKAKGDALQVLIKEGPKARSRAIRKYLARLKRHSAVRNAIAHQTWKTGRRPNAIKPLTLLVHGGSGKIFGLSDNERDYTVTDLWNIANETAWLYNFAVHYAVSRDLLPLDADIA